MNIEETLDAILAHYGTKGMKWGVRKKNVPRQGPSQDAQSAHRHLVKATVNGPQALTNKQLEEVNKRLNLEQNYAKLSYNPSTAKKILDAVFKNGKQVNEAIAFANSPAGKAIQNSLGTQAKSGPAPKHMK